MFPNHRFSFNFSNSQTPSPHFYISLLLHLSIYVYLLIYLSSYLSIHLSIHASICSPTRLSQMHLPGGWEGGGGGRQPDGGCGCNTTRLSRA